MAKTGSKSNKQKVKIYRQKKKGIPEPQVISQLQSKYNDIDVSKIKTFDDLPLSTKTKKALKENEFIEPTDIQKQSIGLALAGNDILGAAKTGSGKTLAFLIPVLEILYCKQWSRADKLGALIISPTRELALQIYETLVKIGKYHDFSAGLIIGGKDLKFEKKRIDQCNIIICTPGRLLHHMSTNPNFDWFSMQIVVLDEADRCLDMGFEKDINGIIENLPPERQTLLFSATQTKSIKDLARLSLKDPMYVSVHENSKYTTPEALQQNYVICKLEDKISMLWSFIRNHLRQKTIVFFSSCKQVKFIYDAFCRMQPGISLLALHGKLHQMKRMDVYDTFCSKQVAVLFATDIAARGLDFPAVNWVVQMDCPEDTNSYIHRAGRTARIQKGGESLLVLLPSEIKMIKYLEAAKIPINMIKINTDKLISPQKKLEMLVARDNALKETGKRAFNTYMKSIYLMKDKTIFDIRLLDQKAYAMSLGLGHPPRLRFLGGENKEKAKKDKEVMENAKLKAKLLEKQKSSDEESDEDDKENSNDEENEEDNDDETSKISNEIKENKNKKEDNLFDNESSDDEDEDDLITIKRKNIQIEGEILDDKIEELNDKNETKNKKPITKAAIAKKILKKNIQANKKTTFDEEGEELIDGVKSKVSELARKYENEEEECGINIERAKEMLREEDKFDRQRFREKIKAKHREEKRKAKAQKMADDNSEEEGEDDEVDDGEGAPRLVSGSEDENSDGPDLSWLPDPDKIYGPKKDTDDEENKSDDEENESDDEEIDQVHRPPKRKLITKDDNKQIHKKQKFKISENSDLLATEELALQLLNN